MKPVAKASSGAEMSEVNHMPFNYPISRIPGLGEYIEDVEGRSWRVVEVEHRGASVLVTAEGTGWSAIDALEALGADEETRL